MFSGNGIADNQSMGITLVKVPGEIYGAQDGNEALFTPDAVEWAMKQILPQ
jgi:hypothetical protein